VSYFEGFGIPIVEAFSAHVPVITSDVTSMPEVAGSAALFIDPFSVESIADGLEKMDTDSDLRSRLIDQGAIELKRFSWELSSQKLWRIIEETIQNAKS
jgi:glycosyltransferase involved in cell wall biosynthesis